MQQRIYPTNRLLLINIPLAKQKGVLRVRISNFLQTCFDRIMLFLRGATEFCSSPNCDVTKQQQCVQIVQRYNSSPSEPEEAISPSDPHEEYQILRHIVLLLILSCSMFVVSALLKILTNFPLLRKVFFLGDRSLYVDHHCRKS